jgi:hypothetical protein
MQITIGRRAAALLVVAAALVLGATYAYASIPDSGGVIHGCFNNNNGQLRVFDTGATKPGPCSQAESALDWNQTGPQGAQGIQGPQGPQGIQGPKGDPATIDNLKTFVVSKDFPIGTFDIQDGTVTCPTGSVITGGSYWFGDGDVPTHQPDGNNGFFVSASSGFFDPDHFTVFAICLRFN